MSRIIKHKLFCFLLVLTFNPLLSQIDTIPGLSLWLSSDSVHISSSSQIDTLYDLSPLKNHAIQLNNNEQAISNTLGLNSHKSIFFDGVDDFYNFNEISDIRTVFWVLKENNLASSNYRPLLGHNTLYDFHRGNGNLIWDPSNASPNITGGLTRVNFNLINSASYFLNPDYSIISLITTGNVTANNLSNDRLTFGRLWSGEFYELIVYNGALTPIQTTKVEEYLNNKYAPPINLGSDIATSCNVILKDDNHNFTNYLWNTGASTPSINVTNSGQYSVIATNVFGKLSYDTINIQINPLSNYNFSDSAFCENESITWNTNLPKNIYTFQWQDNSTDSLFTINQAGNYYVKITDLYGCNTLSDTFNITQDNFSTTASLGTDISTCVGNSITLTSGYSPSHNYSWSTGSTNDSLLINTGGQYSVIVTNTNNCVAKDTINVTILGQAPVANFTTSLGCINSIVNFTDLSVPPSGNTLTAYEWNFGDLGSATNTSTLSNPSHTYTNTGTYTVSLKVISNAGCEQTIRKIIQVFPKPTVNFISGISCQNDSTAFSSLCTSVAGYSITSLNWNFGDPGSANTSNLTNPKHVFGNQANYTIKLVATNNVGCKDSLINIIAVKGQVKADFTYSSACTNTATLFQDNSVVPAPNSSNTRSWNFGTSTANGLTVSKSYTNSGVYSVTLSVTGNNGCNSSISKVITIFNPPVTSFSIPTFCAKDTITINNSSIAQSGIISSYNWKLNNSSFSSIQNPTLSISSAGNYSVSLTTTNNFGCRDSLTKTIMVNPLPIVDFTTNPLAYYYINSPITFSPSINNASFYFWNISTVPTTTIQSPTVTFTNEGTYTASLLLQDQQGCKNSTTKNLAVTKRFLDIAILNVNSSKDADGFISVQADIINYGTIPAYTIDLNYQVSDGGNIKETWTGTLTPNSYFTYTFNSKISTQPHSSNHITCVDARKVNGINDENTDNNKMCSALNTNELSVSNPIPNPTSSDIVLPVILNKDLTFSITIYNSTGQIIYEEPSQNGITGLNLITIPSSNYARGCYIIKTVIDDKIFIKKFIKISNE